MAYENSVNRGGDTEPIEIKRKKANRGGNVNTYPPSHFSAFGKGGGGDVGDAALKLKFLSIKTIGKHLKQRQQKAVRLR